MKDDEKQNQFIQEYLSIIKKYYDTIPVNKKNKGKLKGALVANLIKRYIEDILFSYKLPFKVSENNVYIQGYAIECDLLIVKQDCTPIFNGPSIYRAEDVKAIIESKATGIFINMQNPQNPFLHELEMLKDLNHHGFPVKFGYISLAEAPGKSFRLLKEANLYINKFSNDTDKNWGVYCFSSTYPEDEYPLYEGNPYSFQDYIKHLCL